MGKRKAAMARKLPPTTLESIKKGQSFRIEAVKNATIRHMFDRFGIDCKENLKCVLSSNSGPVVLKKRHQEIALGRKFLKDIEITKVS